MHDLPHGAALLSVARETLLQELLPQVSGAQKYAALMIANAMAIAAREADVGESDLQAELTRFAKLYDERAVQQAGASPSERAASLNARLARDIRAGRFDGESDDDMRTLLFEQICAQLRLSNPKHLKAWGLAS